MTPLTGQTRSEQDRAIGYALLRLAIGMSMLGHGLIRVTKLDTFHAQIVGEFAKSPLPGFLVSLFGYALPFAELVIGALLVIGMFTRAALIAGGLLMVVLIFGSSLIEHWAPIAQQLGYTVLFTALLAFLPHNRYSADESFASSRRAGGAA